MRVVVTAQAADIDALVGPRFGRARWLVFADSETGTWSARSNTDNAEESGGVGVKVAETVLGQRAEALITGHIGPAAQRMLADAGVPAYQVDNGVRVRDALARLAARELEELDAPTVAGHWSSRPSKRPEE